jgi:hypothetical protein
MFEMSSEVRNTVKTLRILARTKNWRLSTTGRSKLFI